VPGGAFAEPEVGVAGRHLKAGAEVISGWSSRGRGKVQARTIRNVQITESIGAIRPRRQRSRMNVKPGARTGRLEWTPFITVFRWPVGCGTAEAPDDVAKPEVVRCLSAGRSPTYDRTVPNGLGLERGGGTPAERDLQGGMGPFNLSRHIGHVPRHVLGGNRDMSGRTGRNRRHEQHRCGKCGGRGERRD